MLFNKKSKKYSKKYRKKTKKFKNKNKNKNRNKNKRVLKGGTNQCLSYIITAAHGAIIHDTENYFILPENIRLIVYSDFCGKSCNSIKSITNYICTHDGEGVEIAYSIINPGGRVPMMYAIGGRHRDQIDSIKISDCSDLSIFEEIYSEDKSENLMISLKELVKVLQDHLKNNGLQDKKIDLHWTMCMDAYDKHKVIINERDTNDYLYYTTGYLYHKLKEESKMENCNENTLGVIRNNHIDHFSECPIYVKKNTLLILSNNNITIYLTYPESIKQYHILPLIWKKVFIKKEIYYQMIDDKINKKKPHPEYISELYKKLHEYKKLFIISSEEEKISSQSLTPPTDDSLNEWLVPKIITYIIGTTIKININLEGISGDIKIEHKVRPDGKPFRIIYINNINLIQLISNIISYAILNLPSIKAPPLPPPLLPPALPPPPTPPPPPEPARVPARASFFQRYTKRPHSTESSTISDQLSSSAGGRIRR